MIHQDCGGEGVKMGFNRSGSQRYKCKKCGKTFSERTKKGRPLLGERPLTSTERSRRSRESKKKSS